MTGSADPRDEPERVFELSIDAICVAGFDGYLKRVNPAFVRLLDYTEDELLARPFIENVHPDDRQSVLEHIAEFATHDVAQFECRVVCADDSTRWTEWHTRGRPDEGVMYATGRDITDRRLADDELSALRHVATLVAEGVEPRALFSVVAEEVARVVGVPVVHVARFEVDGSATVCASHAPRGSAFPIDVQVALDGPSVAQLVRDTWKAARIDDFSLLPGVAADIHRRMGIRSSVGSPIMVGGQLWGAIVVSATDPQPLTEGIEARVADFTELLATAISNAQSRQALERLADEQAALRRVATLVAQAVPATEIFAAVSEEVATVFAAGAVVLRFDHDAPGVEYVGVSSAFSIPVGTRWGFQPGMASAEVFRTGHAARIDGFDFAETTGVAGEMLRRLGIVSTVTTPIVVDRRLWGAISLAAVDTSLPLDTEERLVGFTELVATAIANTESREALAHLAEEQAALRRVATLVAEAVPANEIFAAVSDEVADLFGHGMRAGVVRFDYGVPGVEFVGVSKAFDIPVGTRWGFQPGMASAEVFRTGRTARVDTRDWSEMKGLAGEMFRRLDPVSTVATPILVDGHLWGAVSLSSADEPLPPEAEKWLVSFTELVAIAIANVEHMSELAASRRRIVAASDNERRRIERDLHDGTQQRLVALGLAARAAEADVSPDRPELRSELAYIATGLKDAVTELQHISRGIHPAIVSQGGLAPALRTLGRRSPIPVELDVTTEERFAAPVEIAAYYAACESLANAAKHSHASHIEISLAVCDGQLLLSIRDDGVGGADPARGSGLLGLTDRIEALGGSLRVQSPSGRGTQITVDLPLEAEPAPSPAT